MTVREMRDRLFHIDDQTVAVRRVLPAYAKYTASPNETVEQMRHRLFNLEPQDGPIEKAKDATDRRARDVQKFEVVSKGGSIGSKGPSIMGEHDTVEQACEHAKRLTKQLTPGERKYYGMGYIVRPKKSVGATDRRTRLHAALDAVMDGRRAKDTDAHVGMLGVNAEKAKQLEQRLKRQGFEYRFPVEPPKADMVRHGFVKYGAGEGAGREREWKVLNERKNGYHNITDLTSGGAKDTEEKPLKSCKRCKGTGAVQYGQGAESVINCPTCHGTGCEDWKEAERRWATAKAKDAASKKVYVDCVDTQVLAV